MWRGRAIRAVIFDIGGIVVHADFGGIAKVASMLYGCTEENLLPHLQDLVKQLERGEVTSVKMWEELGRLLALHRLGRATRPERFSNLWSLSLKESMSIDEEMLAVCRELQNKVPVAALSNTIEEHANLFQENGVYSPFNPCILSYEVGMRKPEPEIYLYATNMLQVAPQNCLFIDDALENIMAAREMRMQTHHFTTRENLLRELKRKNLL